MEIKYCPNCGNEIIEESVFCSSCGSNLQKPQSGTDNENMRQAQVVRTQSLPYNNPTIVIQQQTVRTTPNVAIVAFIMAVINAFMMWAIPLLPIFVYIATLIMTFVALAADSQKYKKGLAVFLVIVHIFQGIIILAYTSYLLNYWKGLIEIMRE